MRARDIRQGRPLEDINGWTATITSPLVGKITFTGMNEDSARIRAETHLRNLGRDPGEFAIDVRPPEPPTFA